MSKLGLLLIGAGGHARSCIDVIEAQNRFSIVGLVGTKDEVNTRSYGYDVIATDNDLKKLATEYEFALIAVGQIDSPDNRISLFNQVSSAGFKLPVIISPIAYVSRHASIESGTIVMHGAIVNSGVKIGQNCIINSRALLEHDVIVESHCHIATGAILNGTVNIGPGCFIGSGCVVKQNTSLGERCLVGMGISVRHNQNDNSRVIKP